MTIFTEENLIVPREWSKRAACDGMDPELFFPGKSDPVTTDRAKKVCARCPVAAECLEDAIKNREEHGIFGGLTAAERKELRMGKKKRKRKMPVACSEAGCSEPSHARGLCSAHYARRRLEAIADPCAADDCEEAANGARGLCRKHYNRQHREKTT